MTILTTIKALSPNVPDDGSTDATAIRKTLTGMLHDRHFAALLLCFSLAACGGSDDDDGSPVAPPPDDPVAGRDCLGDIDPEGTTYCVDPVTRVVTATGADGTVDWTVTLADSDFPSVINTLVLVDGQPWLIADAGQWIGAVQRDQDYVSYTSLARGSGGFIQTAGDNSYGYLPDSSDVSAIGIGDSVFVAFDVYELVPGADRSLPDSWRFVGASLTRFEPTVRLRESGAENPLAPQRAKRLYPDRQILGLARTEAGRLLVELDDGSERLETLTLTPLSPDSSRPLLGGQPHETVLPILFTALRGDELDVLAAALLAIGDQTRTTATHTTVIESNAPDAPPPRGTDLDVLERFEYACADGGTLELDRTEKLTWYDGGFRKTETHEEYRYTDCGLQVDVDMPSIDAGTYRLDGAFVLDDLEDIVFQNYTHTRTAHTWRDLALGGPGERSSGTTAQTVIDAELVVSPPSPYSRTTRIESHVQRLGDRLELSIENGEYARILIAPLGETQPFSSLAASGTVDGSLVGGQGIEVAIDPPFEQESVSIVPDQAPGVRTSGRLAATAADNSTLTITAQEAVAPYAGLPPPEASAVLDYLVDDGTTVLEEIKSLESLGIPITLYSVDDD